VLQRDITMNVRASRTLAITLSAGFALLGCGAGSGGSPSTPEATACRDRTPSTILHRYIDRARARADHRLVRLAEHPPKAMRSGTREVALAAAVYASSRPTAERRVAYSVCSFELRRVLTKKGSS
jgi:hypothetical protein